MYAYIIGRVTKVSPKNIICENNNIGYLIITANPYNFNVGEEYKIYLHQFVREDAIELYGFQTEDAKELFLKLISVTGIGPKSALSILASASVNEIIFAIENGNDKMLKKFPGIGQKASQQIILDLRGKLDNIDSSSINFNDKLTDVSDALIALGYNSKEISKAISKLDTSKEVKDLVKDALKLMIK